MQWNFGLLSSGTLLKMDFGIIYASTDKDGFLLKYYNSMDQRKLYQVKKKQENKLFPHRFRLRAGSRSSQERVADVRSRRFVGEGSA
jgi:hypothetical protein